MVAQRLHIHEQGPFEPTERTRAGGAAGRAAAPAARRRDRTSSSGRAATEPRQLPADSTTHHSLELPDRRLQFSATAGAIRILDEKARRSPTSLSSPTSWTVPNDAAGSDLRVQRRPRLLPPAGCMSVPSGHGASRSAAKQPRPLRRPSRYPIPRHGSISPTWCSSIQPAPAIRACSAAMTRRGADCGRSMATSTTSRKRSAAGSTGSSAASRRNTSWARAMAVSVRRAWHVNLPTVRAPACPA